MSSWQVPAQDSAAVRTHRLKLALVTSLAGKGISVVVQFVALPLAITVLGTEKFGAYAMLAAMLNWMSVASISVTPGLTIQLIRASARNDREAECKVFSSAFFFAAAIAAVLLLGAQLVFRVVDIEQMFGRRLLSFEEELRGGLSVLSTLMTASLVLSVAEAAQAGYQRQYIHNIFLSVGNVVTIVAIGLLVRAQPTIANMILAVYAAPLIARALSMAQLIRSRRYLLPRFRSIDPATLRAILPTGSAFALVTLASLCYQSFSVYWVGRHIGPAAAALMSLCTMILHVSGSILLMLTQPLWPAIQDASTRGDLPWVRQAYARISKHLIIYIGSSAVILAFAGGAFANKWAGTQMSMNTLTQCLLGFYFLLAAWEHMNYSFLIGLGHYWYAALLYTAGALLMLLLGVWLVGVMGIAGMLAAMCAGPLFITVWLYPAKIRTLLAARDADIRGR